MSNQDSITPAAEDVKADGSVVLEVGGMCRAQWLADLTALSGGVSPDVTFSWEHSPDNATWYLLATEAALSATGTKTRNVNENLFHFLRISWTVTGSPTTATARLAIHAVAL